MLRLPRRILFSVAALATVLACGCGPQTRMPNLYHPGTADQQRLEAVVHDPYPLNDVGPEIVGGRPLGYQNPVVEVERARMFDQARGISPPSAAPVIMMPPPAVMNSPPPVYSQPLPGAPPPIVNAPPGTPPIGHDPYATSPPAAMPYAPPQAAPYAVGPPVAAPYSPPPPAQPPAPYQYTPATPLEAFPSRSPY